MLKPRPLHWFLALMLVTCASGSGMFGCAQGVGVDETEPADDDDDNSRPPPSSSLAGPDSTTAPGSGGAGPVGPGSGGAGPSTTGAGANGGAGPSTTANTSSMAATTNTSATTNTTATTTAVTSSTAASSSSSGGCTPVNVLLDGGYEGGPSSSAWTQSSTNFPTPICDVAGCGVGGGTGPATGTYWAWFGGSSLNAEISITSQSMVIPVGMATLEFKIELPVCDSFFDVFTAKLDGQTVFLVDGGSAACGQMGYQQVVVNVDAFADGGTHTLELRGETVSFLFGPTNFMVDDVMLVGCM